MTLKRNSQYLTRILVPMTAAIPLSAVIAPGCSDDGGSENENENAAPDVTPYEARKEVVLEVQNEASTVDLLGATEAQEVRFGLDGANLVLEATEVSSNTRRTAVAANDGDSLLLSGTEYVVRYERVPGEQTGTVTLLDADEATVLATEDDVLLAGSEATRFKQNGPRSLTERLAEAGDQWTDGRWSALVAAATSLAEMEQLSSDIADGLQAVEAGLAGALTDIEAVYNEARPDEATTPGVSSRPNLYRVPEANDTFAAEFTFNSFLNTVDRDTANDFFDLASAELQSLSAGQTSSVTTLPSELEDAEGNAFTLVDGVTNLRVGLRWQAGVNLDLSVVSSNGVTLGAERSEGGGGVYSGDNATGGPGASESVVFSAADDGLYQARVNHSGGEEQAYFELVIYENGRIVGLLAQELASGAQSSALVIRVGDAAPPVDGTFNDAALRAFCEKVEECEPEYFASLDGCVDAYDVRFSSYISYLLEEYGPDCANSYAAFVDCGLRAYPAYEGCYTNDEAYDEDACADEYAAYERSCQ